MCNGFYSQYKLFNDVMIDSYIVYVTLMSGIDIIAAEKY